MTSSPPLPLADPTREDLLKFGEWLKSEQGEEPVALKICRSYFGIAYREVIALFANIVESEQRVVLDFLERQRSKTRMKIINELAQEITLQLWQEFGESAPPLLQISDRVRQLTHQHLLERVKLLNP